MLQNQDWGGGLLIVSQAGKFGCVARRAGNDRRQGRQRIGPRASWGGGDEPLWWARLDQHQATGNEVGGVVGVYST